MRFRHRSITWPAARSDSSTPCHWSQPPSSAALHIAFRHRCITFAAFTSRAIFPFHESNACVYFAFTIVLRVRCIVRPAFLFLSSSISAFRRSDSDIDS